MRYWYVMALFNNGRSVEFKAEEMTRESDGTIHLYKVWEPNRTASVSIPPYNLLYADIGQRDR